MKYIKFLTLFAFLTLFMVSCSKDSETNGPSKNDETFGGPTLPTYEELVTPGNDVSPDWTYTPNVDSYQTMTIILQLPDYLIGQVSAEDKLTALAADGTVCGSAEVDSEDLSLYYLSVGAPTCESQEITIAYYCAKLHRIFKSSTPITFKSDETLGTYLNPYSPYMI